MGKDLTGILFVGIQPEKLLCNKIPSSHLPLRNNINLKRSLPGLYRTALRKAELKALMLKSE